MSSLQEIYQTQTSSQFGVKRPISELEFQVANFINTKIDKTKFSYLSYPNLLEKIAFFASIYVADNLKTALDNNKEINFNILKSQLETTYETDLRGLK